MKDLVDLIVDHISKWLLVAILIASFIGFGIGLLISLILRF